MKITKLLLLLSFFSVAAFAQNGDLFEASFTGSSKEAIPQNAKKDIFDQAYAKITEGLIKDLIGEERFNKNKNIINNKIIKNAARFIPFSKPGDLIPEEGGFKMSVALKVSLKELKASLQENSLLNDNESTPIVLPVISFVDKVNLKSFRWWVPLEQEQKVFLQKQGVYLENSLRSGFQKNGFFVSKPQDSGFNQSIPLVLQNEKLNADDIQLLSKYFNASVILDGQVTVSKNPQLNNSYRIEVKISATQVSNGRAIADVSRKVDTEVGSFEAVVDKKMKELTEASAQDLSNQVFEAWQRGSIGTSMLKVALQGKLGLSFLESFKETVRNQVAQVRNIRERLLSSGKYIFEVDTSASPQEIIQKIQTLEVSGKKLNQVSEVDGEILIQIN